MPLITRPLITMPPMRKVLITEPWRKLLCYCCKDRSCKLSWIDAFASKNMFRKFNLILCAVQIMICHIGTCLKPNNVLSQHDTAAELNKRNYAKKAILIYSYLDLDMISRFAITFASVSRYIFKISTILWSFQNAAKLKKFRNIDLTIVPARSTSIFRLNWCFNYR